jgi:hypothetical protein
MAVRGSSRGARCGARHEIDIRCALMYFYWMLFMQLAIDLFARVHKIGFPPQGMRGCTVFHASGIPAS